MSTAPSRPDVVDPDVDPSPPPSVLDGLGHEVLAVVAPVSVCIAVTVCLVRALNPDGAGSGAGVYWAAAAYKEEAGDSASTKFLGSLENAGVFVGFVTATTFALVALFKRGCTRAIAAYMALSSFSVFFFLTGAIAAQLVATYALPVDSITFWLLLWNFAAVGVASLFLCRAPLAMRQAYLVATGVVVAFLFTHVPEWTTWALLGAMAAYDLYAVLTPGGPLRLLVETAEARGEDIPALIYEGRSRRPGGSAPRARAMVSVRGHDGGGSLPLGVSFSLPATMADRGAPLLPTRSRASDDSGEAVAAPAPGPAPSMSGGGSGFGLPDAIKLGLGDFIFYSVLVGRASMYDLLAAAAAALAVLAGLGATLLLLALAGRALPALPISIALGALFTAAARGVVEPVVVPLVAGLVYF